MPVILVVDDDPVMLNVLLKTLSKYDYQVITADSAEKALRKFNANSDIDLVVADLEMPDMTGLELMQRLSQSSRAAMVPVVICSGHTDKSSLIGALKKGAVDFIAKPFKIGTLVATIDSALTKGKSTILTIIDKPEISDPLAFIIEKGGFEVFRASTAETGLEILQTHKINIVIIDVSLPEVAGEKLVKDIKSKYRHVPVLLATDLTNEYSEKIVSDFGAVGYISTPFDSTVIIEKLHNLLKSIPVESIV